MCDFFVWAKMVKNLTFFKSNLKEIIILFYIWFLTQKSKHTHTHKELLNRNNSWVYVLVCGL